MIAGIPLTWLAVGALAVGVALVGGAVAVKIHRADDREQAAEAVGESAADRISTLGAIVYTVPSTVVSQLTYAASRIIPFFGSKWWKGMAKLSLKRYHQRAGGDAVALAGNEQSGKADLKPVKWFDGLDELDDKPGWKIKGEDRYFADSHHGGVVRIGNTPVLPINEDERRAGSWFECNVTEAIDAGNMAELYDVEGADLRATVDYGNAMGGQQPAMSDGGQQVNAEFDPRGSPVFEDMIIDLTSPSDYDGRAMSWWKYSNHDPTSTSPEAIDQAEERGRLAGLAGKDTQGLLIKLLLIAGGIIVGALAAQHLPTILRMLMGGGGGGGGGGAGGFLSIAGTLVG